MEYLTKQEASVVRERKTVIIERVLESLYKTHKKITPQLLVDSAVSPKNELHTFFVWNDVEAGAKYRLAQATAMILATRFVCYIKDAGKKNAINMADIRPIRKFLPYKDQGFRPRIEVLADKEARNEVIERKKSVLRSWCDSVVDIEELLDIRQTILSVV
jgi:hypothetical protein